MYLLLAFACREIEWHISLFILFSFINDISISVQRSNFILVFLKAAYHANPGAKRNFSGSSSHILRHIFLKFSNAIIYFFEHTNQDVLLNFLFENLCKLFCVRVICITILLPYLSDCKNLLHVTMLHWTFSNHSYICKYKYLFTTIK